MLLNEAGVYPERIQTVDDIIRLHLAGRMVLTYGVGVRFCRRGRASGAIADGGLVKSVG